MSAPNTTQEQTGGRCRGSGLKPLALLETSCQGASEDFVPPAAQRKAVRRADAAIKMRRAALRHTRMLITRALTAARGVRPVL